MPVMSNYAHFVSERTDNTTLPLGACHHRPEVGVNLGGDKTVCMLELERLVCPTEECLPTAAAAGQGRWS